MTIDAGRPAQLDPRVDRLLQELAQTWDWQPRVMLQGVHGTVLGNKSIRFLASRATLYVQVHVQTNAAGEGGATYDPVNFRSSELVDTFVERQQDYELTSGGGENFFLWLIPVFEDGDGTRVLYDGVDGPDHTAFWDLGVVTGGAATVQDENWSIMHFGTGGVPISGTLEDFDQQMMIGLYSGHTL